MALASIDPASGRVVASWPEAGDAEVLDALRRSAAAFEEWSRTSVEERAGVLRRAAVLLRVEAEGYARLMAEEMGKPLPQGRAEVEKCAWACEHYAEVAAAELANQPVATEDFDSHVAFRPLGPLLAIMPWNFPFWQVLRCAAPNLAAGNTALLKHAGSVQGCAQAIVSLLHRAGLPDDAFINLPVDGGRVAALIARPEIAAVTLTGSTKAGRAVGQAAGAALKKSVLELGGSDPYVVLAGADVERAAESCVASRLINTGQSCIAAKRFIVVDAVRALFTEAVVERMRTAAQGAPLRQPDVALGPLARADLRDELAAQVDASVTRGARLLLGGRTPRGEGAFYPPTVLDQVRPGQPAFDEETFGPVAAIVPARDEEQAFALANASPFGLGAALFTADAERGALLAERRLNAGSCFVNDYVRSDPRLPFGGIKASGYGRELGSFGLREFVNVKTVCVRR